MSAPAPAFSGTDGDGHVGVLGLRPYGPCLEENNTAVTWKLFIVLMA